VREASLDASVFAVRTLGTGSGQLSGKLEKNTGKLCKIHDTLTTVRYAQPGIGSVIKMLWQCGLPGMALAEHIAAAISAFPFNNSNRRIP
jgi:hypothetical protein